MTLQLANWLRSKLWTARDWPHTLATLCDEATADESVPASKALELAHACELIDPDRRRAIAMYRLAAHRGIADANVRATALALEIGDHTTRAELELAAFDATGEPSCLLAAGIAFIDAGTEQLAIDPLSRYLAANPRDDEAKSALAAARRQLRDAQAEIATWIARATKASRADSSRMYLHAARIARLAGLDAIYARHLETAVQRGAGAGAAALLEARLLQARDADALLALYRDRLERARNDHDWTDTMRAAGCQLILNGFRRGLAVRLVRSSLEHAYRSRLVDIPGHLASWDVLVRHAREARTMHELMPLIVEAMGLPLPDDVRLYLARLGFEIALRDASDREAAEPYAAHIAELVPDDPEVSAFVATEPSDDLVVLIAPPPPPEPPTVTAAAPPPPPTPPPAVVAPPQLAAPRTIVPPPPSPTVAVRAAPTVDAARPAPPDVRSVIPSSALSALRTGNRAVGVPSPPKVPVHPPRQAERVVVPTDVEVQLASGERFTTLVRDVSTLGLFVVTDREIEIGTEVSLELQLPGANALSLAVHRVSAKVVRRAPTGYGLLLISPSGALVADIAAMSRLNR